MRQSGNLVARKFLKNLALTESFGIFLPHSLAMEQFCGRVKEMTNDIDTFTKGTFFYPIFHNIQKTNINALLPIENM